MITIITVNLNNKRGLEKTLESIQSQHSRDFEWIVVDGGSIDGSIDVIKNADISSLKWISEKDEGIFEAMNKGIKMASGYYLLFLNSGDFLVNGNVISNVINSSSTSDIVYGRCNISKNGKVVHTTNPPESFTLFELYNVGLSHQATFIKKDLFFKYGLYDTSYRYNADIEFWYRTIIFQGCSTQKLNLIISDYNLEGISTIKSKTPDFLAEHQRILSHPMLQKIIPDYNRFMIESNKSAVLNWIKSKKFLYTICMCLFNCARFASGLRKSFFKLIIN